MPTLVLHPSDGEPFEVDLDEKDNSLGRSAGCDVVVDEDGVSRDHARIVVKGRRATIEDLESRNGTFVNGKRVERQELRDGDRIRLGPVAELEYVDEKARTSREKSEKKQASKQERGAASGGLFHRTEWVLIPEEPDGATRAIVLRTRVTTVGRRGAASLAIEDESISRMHARLDQEGGELFVSDLKSRNGTLVNDEPVMREKLEPGDILTFGSLPFEIGRRSRFAWDRVILGVASLVALVALGVGAVQLSGWLDERDRLKQESTRLRAEALQSIERGIAASRQGDADFARGYLLNAADMLLYLNLAPPGSSLSQPAGIFRNVARELPADDRDFDFAAAFSSAPVGLENLSNHDFVARRVRAIAIELGLDQEVPDGFVEQVWTFVDRFASNPRSFQPVLDRAPRIHPQLRATMAAAHLPEVFCYVAWQESALVPDITSHAGARGLWQLMPATARELGLTVNGIVDERTDPTRSTIAATRMIGDLLRVIGREQFMCALASYNLGPGAVRKALTRITDPMMPASKKYWYMAENGLIPQETSEYVARIFANMITAEAPERFGLRRPAAW